MSKITLEISSEVKEILSRHPEIHWEKLVNDTLWGYAKKIQLMDKITSKSKLTERDVDTLDRIIKAGLLERYKRV